MSSLARTANSAKKGQLTFVVFHILGSSIESLNEIKDLSSFTKDCRYFLVKNFINDNRFFEWDQATHSSYFKKLTDAVEITIPKLSERAYEEEDQNGGPGNYSFVLRGYVRHWLGQVWDEYDRMKLKDIVANAGAAASRPRPQVVKVADTPRKSKL